MENPTPQTPALPAIHHDHPFWSILARFLELAAAEAPALVPIWTNKPKVQAEVAAGSAILGAALNQTPAAQ